MVVAVGSRLGLQLSLKGEEEEQEQVGSTDNSSFVELCFNLSQCRVPFVPFRRGAAATETRAARAARAASR